MFPHKTAAQLHNLDRDKRDQMIDEVFRDVLKWNDEVFRACAGRGDPVFPTARLLTNVTSTPLLPSNATPPSDHVASANGDGAGPSTPAAEYLAYRPYQRFQVCSITK